jgi:hypothetical protein
VEVDDFVAVCTLCGTPIQKSTSENDIPQAPFPQENPSASKKSAEEYNLNLTWMIITVIFFIPLFVLLTINFVYSGTHAWTGYAISSIIAAWLCVTIVLFFIKNYLVYSTGIMIITGLLLFFFDLHYDKLLWFFPVGLPALLLLYILSLAVIALIFRVKDKGLNVGAFILIAAGMFCLGFDSLLTNLVYRAVKPTWSLVVLSVTIPTALLFLFLHYVMKKRIKYKRVFHI